MFAGRSADLLLGAALAALSGVLTAPVNVNVYGGMGELITFKTFAVIIMGGLGNVRGTFFAACSSASPRVWSRPMSACSSATRSGSLR